MLPNAEKAIQLLDGINGKVQIPRRKKTAKTKGKCSNILMTSVYYLEIHIMYCHFSSTLAKITEIETSTPVSS